MSADLARRQAGIVLQGQVLVAEIVVGVVQPQRPLLQMKEAPERSLGWYGPNRGGQAAMSASAINPYDAVAYPGHSFSQTHPSRLATIAHFHGMSPALPSAMRVLELGCGRGGNLIPMAAQYPRSQFLGIDLSGDRSGRRTPARANSALRMSRSSSATSWS